MQRYITILKPRMQRYIIQSWNQGCIVILYNPITRDATLHYNSETKDATLHYNPDTREAVLHFKILKPGMQRYITIL